jgi:hypothetical protein
MDKTLKEEAVNAVSEMDSLLNKLGRMFLGLECTLEKALKTAGKARMYSDLLAKFTKGIFEDSRHVVIKVSPNLGRELVALSKSNSIGTCATLKTLS